MDKRFRNVSFTTENMEDFIQKCKNQTELLPTYLDRIKNGYELTNKMLQEIDNFDSPSKMIINIEYNRSLQLLKESLK